VQKRQGAFAALGRCQDVMRLEHLGDLVPDPHQGVQRAQRFLKDHRDVVPAQGQHVPLGQFQQIAPLEP